MNNQEKLVIAFAEALGIDVSAINDELKYQSIPEWDSISHMVLISQIEEAFDVSIDTDDVINMSSVAIAKQILQRQNIEF